jgi:TonB family protein
MERFYPKRAASEERGGRAKLSCKVMATGSLTRCSIVEETPKDYGFGEAALSLSKLFRMKPKTIDGKPVGGGAITIPIVFSVPPRAGPGDNAMVLTKLDAAARAKAPKDSIVPCLDDVGDCQMRPLTWTALPDKADAARILANVDPGEEWTGARCVIGADGLLYACAFSDKSSPRATAAAQETIKLLRAPKTLEDGAPTEMLTVLIMFPWDELTKSPVEPKP